MLYRYIFMNVPWSLNYVVYRHFDALKCGEQKMAEAHRVATFVSESEAKDYCAYRNEMTEKYGSDDVSLIERPNGEVVGPAGGRSHTNAVLEGKAAPSKNICKKFLT